MKLLTISTNKLEITRSHLRKPMLTIGRAPSCDVILRAPGVAPIHFFVEWIGGGEFDPKQGAWAIVDVSRGAERAGGTEGAEGVVLSHEPVTMSGFVFSCIDDKLESEEVIGGQIAESLTHGKYRMADILELVQVRVDSGAVELVSHYPVPARAPRKSRKERLVPRFREFKVEWMEGQGSALLKVLLEEMPGAEVFSRGLKIQIDAGYMLKANDLLQVRWKGRDFYLRFVDRVNSPPIPRDFWGDPLLRKLTYWVGGIGLILLLLIRFWPTPTPEEKPPERIARVEVYQPKAAEPPPPTPQEAAPPKEEKIEQTKATKPDPSTAKAPLRTQDTPKKSPGKAAAPRQISKPDAKPKAGLNSPARVTNVNQVGILGALSAGPRGKGVKADKVLNEGIVTEAATGLESSKVVIRNPPAGAIGTGGGGSPVSSGKGLGGASTTLAGAGKYDPSSVGAIARKGGASGSSLGSSLSGDGSGLGKGKDMGSVDGGDFSVEGGGLDRETVRRVIQSKRGEIRTCYERALLTQSSLEGRIVYAWRITPDGSVVAVEITKSNLEAPALRSCVLDVIRKIMFPRAGNGRATRVIYPFVFQGKR